jgi:hypothetical protein
MPDQEGAGMSEILGGFNKSYRKELKSDVWVMPPIYHRIWYWLRLNAQHETYLFPTRKRFGIWVLPGQRITSLRQIAEGVKWIEWGKDEILNVKTIKDVLGWLESHEMVTVVSNTKGTLISIVNWHIYNDLPVEKVTPKSNTKGTRSGHKEEGIELKSKSISSPEALRLPEPISIPPLIDDVVAYCKERGRGVDPHKWFDFYASKGWMIGKNKMKDWRAAVRTWEKDEPKQELSPSGKRIVKAVY